MLVSKKAKLKKKSCTASTPRLGTRTRTRSRSNASLDQAMQCTTSTQCSRARTRTRSNATASLNQAMQSTTSTHCSSTRTRTRSNASLNKAMQSTTSTRCSSTRTRTRSNASLNQAMQCTASTPCSSTQPPTTSDAKLVPTPPRRSARALTPGKDCSLEYRKRKVPPRKTTSQLPRKRRRTNLSTATTWSVLGHKMALCADYAELEELVMSSQGPPLPTCKNHSIVSTKSSIDKNSLKIIDQKSGLWPVQIYGEGNCLPLTVSVLHYGTKNHKEEMRARIVAEGVVNKRNYLDHNYLKVGAKKLYRKANLPKIFAQYSEQYTPGDILTPAVVERIYEEELLHYTKNGTYSGIWQIAMSAAVLGRKVISHYPSIVNPSIVADLDRCFLPHDKEPCKEPAHIQWTYCGKMTGTPNHFVPLLPMNEPLLNK